MSDPYIGEIRIFAGNYAPQGWHFCDGSVMSIAANDTLFSLIGTTYGGDGQETYNLPDLRGRLPIHRGQGAGLTSRTIGDVAGSETVTVLANQLPAHAHPIASGSAPTLSSPAGALAATGTVALYVDAAPGDAMAASSNKAAGGSQPHENRMPYLGVSFIISLLGIYPSQS